ncbi:MAG TPA: CotH kinase family protein [Bryobacteraceae bacterium]
MAASVCCAQGLHVAATQQSVTIYPGQQNVPVTVSVSGGTYTGLIDVTLTGLPSGITISPLTLNPGASGVLYISASRSAGQEGFDPTILDGQITSWTAPLTLVAAAGTSQATAPFSLTISISNSSFEPPASAINLPIVRIDTRNVAIESKTVDVPGTITITSADGQTSYLPSSSATDNSATFHVHGNSTSYMPKLPYHVKLNSSVDLLEAMGLQCPYASSSGKAICDKSKSFILLANYDDKTLLRDWSALALANAIPMGAGYLASAAGSPSPSGTSALLPWAPHSLFVELFVNSVYEGNYQLVEEIKIDSHRVNITEMAETDTSTKQVTGGYLMEIDQRREETYSFVTPQDVAIGLTDPDFSPNPEVPEQTSYIFNYVNAAENALFADDYTDPNQGWRAYFDEAAAINFYIVNDLMGNEDGGTFNSSDYLYKDRGNPLLYMGPVWDFDISSGNVNYSPIVNPVIPWMQTNAPWYSRLFSDTGFSADVAAQWNALKTNGVFDAWFKSIENEAGDLDQSQRNNFSRWPVQGIRIWPNAEAADSYSGEIEYYMDWLHLRFGFLDSQFNSKTSTQTTLSVADGAVGAGSPAVLTAGVSSTAAPAGVVTFLADEAVIGAASLTESGNATFTISSLPPGAHVVEAIYNGDNRNALSLSSTAVIIVAPPLTASVTSLAGPFLTQDSDLAADFAVSVIGNSGGVVPTGTATFTLDLEAGSAVTLDSSGRAAYRAESLTPGTHFLTCSYAGDANYAASRSITIVFSPSSGGAVTPSVGSVLNAASGAGPQVISPGSYIAIYGSDLADSENTAAASLPLSTTLNGTQVFLGGVAIPLLYASASQVNALVPMGLAPNASYPLVVVHGTAQSNPLPLAVNELQPGIYTLDSSGRGPAVVADSFTGAMIGVENAAHGQEFLTVYCTGLGNVVGPDGEAAPADGTAAPEGAVFHTTAAVTATIGGVDAPVSFAGLTPTFAGLYQLNIQVPDGVASGSAALVITAVDPQTGVTAQSNTVSLTTQ